MDGQVIFWIALAVVTMDIGWLYLGSYNAVEHYRDEIKKGEDPTPDNFSISFSSGSAFTIFFISVLMAAYLLDSSGIVTTQSSVDVFLKTHGLWVFIGTLFVFFGIFVTACEWLLRKMARRKEPNIRFERWFCLK